MPTPLEPARPAGGGAAGRRAWIAVAASVAVHAAAVAAYAWATRAPAPAATRGEPSLAIDEDVAPAAPTAEKLPAGTPGAPGDDGDDGGGGIVYLPVEALVPAPPAAEDDPIVVPDAGAPEPPADPAVAEPARDRRPRRPRAPAGDGGEAATASVPSDTFGDGDGAGGGEPGDPTPGPRGPVSAATAGNLLAFAPDGHVVAILIRFDRLRGTEWAAVAQQVLAVMPDFTTLVADPARTVVADRFDLVAISTPRPDDVPSTLLAVKTAMTPAELRDFLDEPGAPVRWSRAAGGVLGTRVAGKRTFPGDPRVFLAPQGPWMVLAQPRDLGAAVEPAAGDLDGAAADPARLPAWLARVPALEDESGTPDTLALMMTMAPRVRRWSVPDVGLGVSELPAPQRVTLSLEIDPQGFVVRGNLVFADAARATTFVEQVERVRGEVLDTAAFSMLLRRAHALHAVRNLSLERTGARVSYATSVSVADARVLTARGVEAVADYFEAAAEAVRARRAPPAAPDPAPPDPAAPDAGAGAGAAPGGPGAPDGGSAPAR